MEKEFQLPITRIGEPDWITRLQRYLEANEISCTGENLATIKRAEASLELQLPDVD